MALMNIYLDEIRKELYKNIRNQIELQNKIADLTKGNLVVKKRYNEEYFYLSYRDNNTVKTDYLGKLNNKQITKIEKEIEKRKSIKAELSKLRQEDHELRKIILAINRKAFIKSVYDVMDIIVLVRPLLISCKAKEAYLFGSYARGERSDKSDINLEIIGSNKAKEDLEEKLEKLTNKSVNILFGEDKISDSLRDRIDDEKLLIYVGNN